VQQLSSANHQPPNTFLGAPILFSLVFIGLLFLDGVVWLHLYLYILIPIALVLAGRPALHAVAAWFLSRSSMIYAPRL
jgi:hypothetical protein